MERKSMNLALFNPFSPSVVYTTITSMARNRFIFGCPIPLGNHTGEVALNCGCSAISTMFCPGIQTAANTSSYDSESVFFTTYICW